MMNADQSDLLGPEIIELEKRYKFHKRFSKFFHWLLPPRRIRTSTRVNTHIDINHYAPEELHLLLTFRFEIAKLAQKRSAWFGGRFYNRMAGESGRHVPLSGKQVVQVLEVVKRESRKAFKPKGKYGVRVDIIEDALANLERDMVQPSKPKG